MIYHLPGYRLGANHLPLGSSARLAGRHHQDGPMNLLARCLPVLLIATACSSGDAVTTTLRPSTTSPASSTTLPPATTTTTQPPTTTTTTTTMPRLDRSDLAAIGRMRADLDALLSGGPRVSGSAAEAAAIAYFVAVADKVTGGAATLQTVPLPGGAPSANAWVEVGSGAPVLLLGGHIDSVDGAPGADDNGSGVVVLLELLRRLHEDPPEGLVVMIVAFGAEERIGAHGHHFGSRHAATVMAAEGSLPDFMVSVDMIGVGAVLQVVDHRDSDSGFADEIAGVAAEAGIDVGRQSRGEVSDHVPFARAGVSAALLNRPDNPAWHTPQDHTVDDTALLVALRLVEAIVAHLERPPGQLEGGAEHHL